MPCETPASRHKKLRRAAAVAAVTALLTASLPVGNTWAWFSSSSSSGVSAMQAATYTLEITIPDAQPNADGTYTLGPGTHTITLTSNGSATQGYCRMEYGAKTVYTETIQSGLPYSFQLELNQEETVTFTPIWGSYGETMHLSDYLDAQQVSQGGTVGETTEAAQPTEETRETTPEETQPEETIPGETAPEETIPQETTASADAGEILDALSGLALFTAAPADPPAAETIPEETAPPETAPSQSLPEAPPVSGDTLAVPPPSDMPLYFQNDYPSQRYGTGTVATSGCGITSLAMVATYLTGHTYLPDQLAQYFGGRAENNIARMELAATTLELPWSRAENYHVTYQALKEGKVAIVLMEGYNGLCPFTDSQHFLVLRGLTEEGKILVHDSYQPNYQKWDLKAGFESGFTEYQILSGYSGGWIFDPEAVPEDPIFYYEEPAEETFNYPSIDLTLEEQELIAKVIWVEAQGECAEGQQAVAEVILNRLVSDQFGDTVNDVIYARGQFRSVPKIPDATPWQAQYDALDRALYGERILPEDVYYFATTPTNANIWGKIGGHIFCYASSAT